MELRSAIKVKKDKEDFKELQLTLKGFGFYEEGMELNEMRELMDALQASMSLNVAGTLDGSMEQALKESELGFMAMQDVHNSTMNSLSQNRRSLNGKSATSPSSSPDVPAEKIIVHALVHHELDWSPPKRHPMFFSALELKAACKRRCLAAELEANDAEKVIKRQHLEDSITSQDEYHSDPSF